MLKIGILPINDKQLRIKLKKNALEFVDHDCEKKNDPKYKTEMCKSWSQTGFCVYGNKCRFAHGRHELYIKPTVTATKYKQKDCNSFKEQGYCLYGTRCNFKHDQRRFDDLERSYHTLYLLSEFGSDEPQNLVRTKRLKAFESYAMDDSQEECYSPSTMSNSPPQSFSMSPHASYMMDYNLSQDFEETSKDQKMMFNYPCYSTRRLY